MQRAGELPGEAGTGGKVGSNEAVMSQRKRGSLSRNRRASGPLRNLCLIRLAAVW